MTRPYSDIMTISLTINYCVLVYNIVPRLRSVALSSSRLKHYKLITNVCRHYAEKPLEFAKICTNQSLLWLQILCSLVAIGASDVIRYPFHSETSGRWQRSFVETVFAVNIGRYIFNTAEKLIFRRPEGKAQFRAEIVHHTVTMLCYTLFLSYGQNLLLGLVGILIESTSLFDEIGRYCKERERRHTLFYRRLVVVNCVAMTCFRGVIPTTFLVIAMFQQSPFAMNYAPLMIFFLSIIFYSVINVWSILLSIQRLIKYIYEKSYELRQVANEIDVGRGRQTLVRNSSRGAGRLTLARNDLGYCRAYENKNIVCYADEKQNLNNRKDFAKETLDVHINPGIFFSSSKFKLVQENNSDTARADIQIRPGSDQNSVRNATVVSYSSQNQFRSSNSTTDSTNSAVILLDNFDRSSHSNNYFSNNRGRENVDELEELVLEPRFHPVRSLSMDDIANSRHSFSP
ncbi:hypothetical protein ACF0H5_006619 [Mactra antiquata]